MNDYHINLQMSNEHSPPVVKFFQRCATEGQAIFIRGESQFSVKVQQELHADIVANSFLNFFEGSVGIELKVRSPQYAGKRDILIETRSCTKPGRESPGWIYTCEADLLCYENLQYGTPLIRIRILDMPGLKLWFHGVDLTQIKPIVLPDKNRTESYPILWQNIPVELILYDGFIDREGKEIKRLANRQPVIPVCVDEGKVQLVKLSLWEKSA
jgi:hypothetical protein